MQSKSPHIGQVVVMNGLPDAARFEIIEVNEGTGTMLVREEGTDYKPQWIYCGQIHSRVEPKKA